MGFSTGKLEKVNMVSFATDSSVDFYNNYKGGGIGFMESFITKKYIQRKGKVLDLACGTGRTTRWLHDLGFDVIGIDSVPEMIEEAQRRHPGVKFQVMDAAALKYKDGEFDYVINYNSIDCIHPLNRRKDSIAESARVLKQGGLFLYSWHNAWCISPYPSLMKVWITNILNGRVFSSRYRHEVHGYGTVFIHYNSIFSEKQDLRKWFSKIRSDGIFKRFLSFLGYPFMVFFEPFPYLISKKR